MEEIPKASCVSEHRGLFLCRPDYSAALTACRKDGVFDPGCSLMHYEEGQEAYAFLPLLYSALRLLPLRPKL